MSAVVTLLHEAFCEDCCWGFASDDAQMTNDRARQHNEECHS